MVVSFFTLLAGGQPHRILQDAVNGTIVSTSSYLNNSLNMFKLLVAGISDEEEKLPGTGN